MTFDRAAHLRTEEKWIADQQNADTSRWVVAGRGGLAIGPDLDRRTLARLPRPRGVEDEHVVFLGLEHQQPLFGAFVGDENGIDLVHPLKALARLEDEDAEIAAAFLGLFNWHRTHSYCAACGGETRPVSAGHARRCESCSREHYPRTDPVVQILVHDGNRCLLGRSAGWPDVFFSVLAGFVETGERLEEAAARELHEDTGLRADSMRAGPHQPWPMPHQLLFGFVGRCEDVRSAVASDDLAEVRFYTRAELREAMRARRVMVPPRRVLAGRLIREWLDAVDP